MRDTMTLRMAQPTGNRLLDRLLAPDFLDGLAERPIEEVRGRRGEAEQEETELSYLRRLLQARIDILDAELGRRRRGESLGSLVDALPTVLADQRSEPRGMGRHATLEPARIEAHRRFVEELVDDVELSDPTRHDDDTLERFREVLLAEEREVSRKRRAVQAVMDACTAELGRRYTSGDANPADLLPKM